MPHRISRPILRALLALLMLAFALPASAQNKGPLVLAAASLQESMTALADTWTRKGHARPVLSFAGSQALARQIRAGAPADLFVSADQEWMDAVAGEGFLYTTTRADMAGNALVLIAPAGSRLSLRIARNFPIAGALGRGRLSMADPDSVPAGKYGKAALESLGVWPGVQSRIARSENVRSALALVERGEAPLGIVYATDARASNKVRVVGAFTASSHAPIRYPLARLKASKHREAEAFRRFLLSREAARILARYGFTRP
jgi:molybdate transport system substrate-binding protein